LIYRDEHYVVIDFLATGKCITWPENKKLQSFVQGLATMDKSLIAKYSIQRR
jgi:hypothetical protein